MARHENGIRQLFRGFVQVHGDHAIVLVREPQIHVRLYYRQRPGADIGSDALFGIDHKRAFDLRRHRALWYRPENNVEHRLQRVGNHSQDVVNVTLLSYQDNGILIVFRTRCKHHPEEDESQGTDFCYSFHIDKFYF